MSEPGAPTEDEGGDCFEVAGKMALHGLVSSGGLDSSFRVVHGRAIGQGKIAGIAFEHAWVEINDVVIDQSNGRNIAMSRDEYYRIGKVHDVRRYSAQEARECMLETEHYGPWDTTERPWSADRLLGKFARFGRIRQAALDDRLA